MKAAGVQELSPMRDPWITFMVYGRISAMLNAGNEPITRLRGEIAHRPVRCNEPVVLLWRASETIDKTR